MMGNIAAGIPRIDCQSRVNIHLFPSVLQDRHEVQSFRESSWLNFNVSSACRSLQQFIGKPTFACAAISEALGQKGISQHLDDSDDYVCLNFGSNLAAAMFVRNRGYDVVGCSFQFSRFSGLDFVAKKSSVTIGNGRKAR